MKDFQITPCRTVVASFTPKVTAASQLQSSVSSEEDYFEQGDWVLCVTSNNSNQNEGWVSCALSNGEIQVYDQSRMHHLQTFHHDSHVTDLVCDCSNPNLLAASATDGTITLYDVRQQHHQHTHRMKLPRHDEEALSLSLGFDGSICAVGSNKAKIHFLDVRAGSVLGSYNQSHTDEVTRVRFQTLSSSFGSSNTTTTTSTLISGAEDGLACVFDTSQASEEAALKNILTVQSPIREIGFFGPQSEAIYCLTGSETLQLYHKDDAACRKDFGPQFRQYLSRQLNFSSKTNNNNSCNIDYLVDCHWDAPRQELLLLAGSANGNAGVFSVGQTNGEINLAHYLRGGHRGVLRAWHALSTNIFVTVGEDARMCEWNRLGKQMHSLQQRKEPEIILAKPSNRPATMPRSGGGKFRRPRGRMTSSPY